MRTPPTTPSAFFAGIAQSPLQFGEHAGRAPLFFRDVDMMSGAFLCSLPAARALMPTPRHEPLEVLPGKAVAVVHCIEYRDSDVGPYNEVALSVLLDRHGALPGLPGLATALLGGELHAHILDLPVDTEIALQGGLVVFGYPKYLSKIAFCDDAQARVCEVRDRQTGALILSIRGNAVSTQSTGAGCGRLDVMTLRTYPLKDGAALRTRMRLHRVEHGDVLLRGMTIKLGAHPRAATWRALGLGNVLLYSRAPRCEAILDVPELLGSAS